MLEDFLEVNKIKAEIISFPTPTSTNSALSSKKIPYTSTVKIKLFNSEKEPFLVISPFHSETDFKKLKKIMGISKYDILEANDEESISITGYKKDYIPPISIFGLKMIIDSSIETKDFLCCKIGQKKFIKIGLDSIKEYNEEIIFENIIKK